MALFLVLRGFNLYGDPRPWNGGVLAFLNTTKYPASFSFLLMTLGPTIALLPLLDHARGPVARWLTVFGRVPFFFYLLHIPLIHALALVVSKIRLGRGEPMAVRQSSDGTPEVPDGYTWSLGLLYLVLGRCGRRLVLRLPVVRGNQGRKARLVAELRLIGVHGSVAPSVNRNPRCRVRPAAFALRRRTRFQLLLWEYVAYLAGRRDAGHAAFAELKATVGLKPAEVAVAPLPVLSEIARARADSIAIAQRASRMRRRRRCRCAIHGREDCATCSADSYAEARGNALKAFPSIGPPGADKILLLTRSAADPGARSRTRCACSCGWATAGSDKNYATSYAGAQAGRRWRSSPRRFRRCATPSCLLRRPWSEPAAATT